MHAHFLWYCALDSQYFPPYHIIQQLVSLTRCAESSTIQWCWHIMKVTSYHGHWFPSGSFPFMFATSEVLEEDYHLLWCYIALVNHYQIKQHHIPHNSNLCFPLLCLWQNGRQSTSYVPGSFNRTDTYKGQHEKCLITFRQSKRQHLHISPCWNMLHALSVWCLISFKKYKFVI